MKLVIEINESKYERLKFLVEQGFGTDIDEIIVNATPLTDCADAISRELAIKHLTKARMLGDSRPMEDIFAEIPSVNPTTDLSKIRAEIAQKALEPDYQHDCEDWRVGLIMAEEIIDKYSKGGDSNA